ncbi:MAG: hypothetical protein K8S55_07455 [Phycisphaerae bacterium]|nr:hypothetical protein [Phycisphaerae bacterium]
MTELLYHLALTIIIPLVSLTGPNTAKHDAAKLHFWDIEKQQEFTITPDVMDYEMMMIMGDGPEAQLVKSPLTGKKTGVPMIRCPNCKKYFIPEAWKKGKIKHGIKKKCTHCGTDYDEYYRKKRDERRARRKARKKGKR